MAEKIWFITGASRGFGRVWTQAALARGDKVAATARDPASLSDLAATYRGAVLPLKLDVTDRAAVFDAVARAHAHFGRLDVIVNNAGYGLFGTIEEATETEARAQLETNVFGALWVIQAALPLLRQQRGGHILSVSSIGGIVAFPTLGMYHASKWALEAINDTLAQEVAAFGIKVTLIEPGGYATDWGGSSAAHTQSRPEYAELRAGIAKMRSGMVSGDPDATSTAIFKVVDSEQPPLRLFLGTMPFPMARRVYQERIDAWEKWAEVANGAQGQPVR